MTRAQISTEMVLVFSFSLFALVGGVYFFYTQSVTNLEKIDEAQLSGFAQNLATAAETVYASGAGTRRTVTGSLPLQITSLSTRSNWSLHRDYTELIIISQDETFVFSIPVPFNATLFDRDSAPGKKHAVLEAFVDDGQPFVMMSFGSHCPVSTSFDLAGNNCVVDAADIAVATACLGSARPSRDWNDQWYTCYRADYDGNCTINTADTALLAAKTGQNVC